MLHRYILYESILRGIAWDIQVRLRGKGYFPFEDPNTDICQITENSDSSTAFTSLNHFNTKTTKRNYRCPS